MSRLQAQRYIATHNKSHLRLETQAKQLHGALGACAEIARLESKTLLRRSHHLRDSEASVALQLLQLFGCGSLDELPWAAEPTLRALPSASLRF